MNDILKDVSMAHSRELHSVNSVWLKSRKIQRANKPLRQSDSAN